MVVSQSLKNPQGLSQCRIWREFCNLRSESLIQDFLFQGKLFVYHRPAQFLSSITNGLTTNVSSLEKCPPENVSCNHLDIKYLTNRNTWVHYEHQPCLCSSGSFYRLRALHTSLSCVNLVRIRDCEFLKYNAGAAIFAFACQAHASTFFWG